MATKPGVATTLAFLHELFPTREITAATGEAWLLAFLEVPDEMLMAAAQAHARAGSRFFPTAGEVWAYIPRTGPPPLTAAEVLKQITALGHDGPHFEWVLPTVERVRECLGDAAAAAYGAVGPHRLGSDSPTTREIAERDFAVELGAHPVVTRAERIALASPAAAAALEPGPGPEVPAVASKRLTFRDASRD
jgi:hypothetical protein